MSPFPSIGQGGITTDFSAMSNSAERILRFTRKLPFEQRKIVLSLPNVLFANPSRRSWLCWADVLLETDPWLWGKKYVLIQSVVWHIYIYITTYINTKTPHRLLALGDDSVVFRKLYQRPDRWLKESFPIFCRAVSSVWSQKDKWTRKKKKQNFFSFFSKAAHDETSRATTTRISALIA